MLKICYFTKELKHKYKIASFIGNEKDSAKTIIKEIIYFVYEVPRKEIFEHLESQIYNHFEESDATSGQFKAYKLARKISENLSDVELIHCIDENFDIIYEKLSSQPIAIVIDNLQFFSTSLTYFLQKYVNYSKHQTRSNQSVLVISINQDYTNSNVQNFLNFIQEIEKDRPEFLSNEITGFKDINQAILFLRELLNIEDEHSDAQLKILAKKASLIPYHIHQTVYSLLDDRIVQYNSKDKGFIANMSKFYNAIEIMPNDIHNILGKRWRFMLEKYNLEEKDCKVICSLISINGFINQDMIETLILSEICVTLLTKHSFLKEDDNGIITFDHDIIENFIIKYYRTQYYEIFSHIKHKNLQDDIGFYMFLNYFYKLKKSKVSLSTLKQIVQYSCAHQPPYKMVEPFFALLIKVLKYRYKEFDSGEDWINNINKACSAMRNVIGFQHTLQYYQSINCSVEEIGVEKFLNYAGFRNYINTYTDILLHLRKSDEAILYLNAVLENILDSKENDQYHALMSMIYNRMMINHREYDTPHHIMECNKCLSKSLEHANTIKNTNLRDEFVYLNLSDEGYIYYALEKDKDKLLSIWEKCKEYPPERLPQKTLNYYRKMIQLNLIYENIKETKMFIEKMHQYIDSKSYTNERIIFSLFALTAEAICLIMENPVANYQILRQHIEKLMLLSKIKGGNKEYNILNLKAIIAYYNKNFTGMLEAFNEAYYIITHIEVIMHLRDQIDLLIENIIWACINSGNEMELNKILYDKSPAWIKEQIESYQRRANSYKAKGILHTVDYKFNLPIIV